MQQQQTYTTKEIIWAKVKGYPWWPAEITKLPSGDVTVFKVVFIAEQTHAFLEAKDVRKYSNYYEEYSKKKMRGLSPAIEMADQIVKKRMENSRNRNNKVTQNPPSPLKRLPSPPAKTKPIKKKQAKQKIISNSESPSQSEEQAHKSSQPVKVTPPPRKGVKNKQIKQPSQIEDKEISNDQNQMMEEEDESCDKQIDRLCFESSQRAIDRIKIDRIEDCLLKCIEEMNNNSFEPSKQIFEQLQLETLSGQQLVQSKITNMLNFIQLELKKQSQKPLSSYLQQTRETLKEMILDYLSDTNYYDQYIRIIDKNKKYRNQFENKLIYYMNSNYKIKKQLAIIFAQRLNTQISNGAIFKEKQLLDDFKNKSIELGNVGNKAAIERAIDIIVHKYI